MKKHFSSIEEFFSVKENCVFCQSKLKIVFINFIRFKEDLPIIQSREKNGVFSFILKYTADSFELETEVEIDIKTNVVTFYIPSKQNPSPKVMDYWAAQQVFENLGPHVELYCDNKACEKKYHYHVCSNTFKCDNIVGNPSAFQIKNIKLYMESFTTKKLWIQNDWSMGVAKIWHKSNVESEPIKTKLLELEGMGEEKILTRIKTLVTFS